MNTRDTRTTIREHVGHAILGSAPTTAYVLLERREAIAIERLLLALEEQHRATLSSRTGPDMWTDRVQFEHNIHRVILANAAVRDLYATVCQLPREPKPADPLGVVAIVPPTDGPWQRVCRWVAMVVGRGTRVWA